MVDKVNELRPGVVMAFAGLAADGRVLVSFAREFVARYRMTYDQEASLHEVALAMAGKYQAVAEMKVVIG